MTPLTPSNTSQQRQPTGCGARLATTSSSGVASWAARSVVVAALLTIGGGCQRPLFNEKDPRSQFDTYDRLRQQNQSLLVPDEFGNPQPALRARLSPQS